MAFACFLGLQPNEIAPLRWEDIDEEWLHIQRGYVRGKLDVPKTRESLRSVPLIDRVRVPLELWRQKSKNPLKGLVVSVRGHVAGKPNSCARIEVSCRRFFSSRPAQCD